MNKLSLYFDFEGVPKGRPRLGKFKSVYTPQKTKIFERKVSISAINQLPDDFKLIEDTPIKASVEFSFSIPKSKQRKSGIIPPHTVKPDLDNLLKSLFDGLEGIVFKGDQQINEILASKKYDTNGHIKLVLLW